MELFKKDFLRDVALLLIITIVLGSGFSAAVAYGIDTYFGDTLSGLVGEYGEYQLLVHVQQEAKEAAKTQLEELLRGQFPGAKLHEGISVAGTSNFFVAFPERDLTKNTFTNLGRLLKDLPGQSGYTILLEPTVVVQGVEGNIYGELIAKIEKLSHVRFAFRQGGQIFVYLAGPQYSQEVGQELEKILAGYRILEIRFPQGSSIEPAQLGEELAKTLSLKLEKDVRNLSGSGKGEELDALAETLGQFKGFLESYVTKVELELDSENIQPGTLVAIGEDLVVGEPVTKGSLLVEIQEVAGTKARGIIQKGEQESLQGSFPAYLLKQGKVSGQVGQVTFENQRQRLAHSLRESRKLLEELSRTSRDAGLAAKESLKTIAGFQKLQQQVVRVEGLLVGVEQLLASPLGKVKPGDFNALMTETKTALAEADAFLNQETGEGGFSSFAENLAELNLLLPPKHPLKETVEGLLAALKLLSGAGSGDNRELLAWRRSFAADVLALVRAEPEEQRRQVQALLASTRSLSQSLELMDPTPFEPLLRDVEERASAFEEIDLEGISQEAGKLAAALPDLSDETLSDSLKLMDQYLGAQGDGGGAVSLLLRGDVDLKKAQAMVREELGSTKPTLYPMQVGVVKPNMRSEVMRILGEVRLTITALLIVAVTLVSLFSDHATLIAAGKIWQRNHTSKLKARRQRFLKFVPYLYGAGTGVLLLGGMLALTGAQLPLIPTKIAIAMGGVLGLVVALFAEKFSPVAEAEMIAAEAMGLSWTEIMRQVVIPGGRPALGQLLNKKRVLCGKGGGSLNAD